MLHIGVGGDVGGGERYLLLFADRINKEKYKLLFVSSQQKTFVDELRKRNLETLIVNMESKFNIRALFQLRDFIKANKIKIVHTHGPRGSFYGRLAARWAGVPIIISTIHVSIHDYPVCKLKRDVYILLDRLTAHFCDKIICVAKALADNLICKSKINPDKFLVIHNGIDLERFSNAGDTYDLLKGLKVSVKDKKIGIVGRLSCEKGHRYFLEAVAEVKKIFPDIKCLIVGDGPLRKELERLSERLGVFQNCIFTGTMHNIPEILSVLDVLVLSSVSEGLPMILLEAMAARCPVVATRIGGIPELVEDNKTGILVEPKDSRALARAIESLLQNKEKAREMASLARSMIEREFMAEEMAKKIEDVYENLVRAKCGVLRD